MTLRKSTDLAVVVGQLAVIHDLQQDVEQVGMRLLDLVEQQHAVRMLVDRVGQAGRPGRSRHSPAARRSGRDTRVPLHVFGHVEAGRSRSPRRAGELARHLGLADAGRAREQIAADRLLRLAQARRGQLDRRDQRLDRLCPGRTPCVCRIALAGSSAASRSSRDTLFGGMRAIVATHASTSFTAVIVLRRRLSGTQHLRRAGLVDHVDRLVRQLAVVDVALRQLDRRA